jgi:hypothetical protein
LPHRSCGRSFWRSTRPAPWTLPFRSAV